MSDVGPRQPQRPRRKVILTGYAGLDPERDARFAYRSPDPAEASYLRDRINEAVRALPPTQRRVFTLRRAGLPFHDIAVRLNTTDGAARVAHHRAIKRLRVALHDLAPALVFLIVLSLLVLLTHAAPPTTPTSPLPILPRSESGVYIDPSPPGACEDAMRTDTVEPRVPVPGLRLTIEPQLGGSSTRGELTVYAVVTNPTRNPVTIDIRQLRATLFGKRQGRVVADNVFAPDAPLLALRAHESRRLSIPVRFRRCTGGAFQTLRLAATYQVAVGLRWHEGRLYEWRAQARAIRAPLELQRPHLPGSPVPRVRPTVRVSTCPAIINGRLYLATTRDVAADLRIHSSPDNGVHPLREELRVESSIENLNSTPHVLYLTTDGVITSRQIKTVLLSVVAPPRRIVTVLVEFSLENCPVRLPTGDAIAVHAGPSPS